MLVSLLDVAAAVKAAAKAVFVARPPQIEHAMPADGNLLLLMRAFKVIDVFSN